MRYDFPMILMIAGQHLVAKLVGLIDRVRSAWLLWLWGVKHGKNVWFTGPTILLTHHRGDITVGDNVVFNSRIEKNLVGLMNPTILSCLGHGHIRIGNDSGFSSVVISSRTAITIGSNVKVGGNVRIFDHDFHAVEWQNRRAPEKIEAIRAVPVVVGDDVFIGTNAILLKGTRIGDRSVVSAGSVVFGLDIPADSLVKGNPAKIISFKKGTNV